ncbi:hypothetical protein IC582_002125 [Cucumis melo]
MFDESDLYCSWVKVIDYFTCFSLIYLELFFSDLVLVVVFVCLRRQPLEVHRRAILDWRICVRRI